MKKLFILLIIVAVLATTSCGTNRTSQNEIEEEEQKVQIFKGETYLCSITRESDGKTLSMFHTPYIYDKNIDDYVYSNKRFYIEGEELPSSLTFLHKSIVPGIKAVRKFNVWTDNNCFNFPVDAWGEQINLPSTYYVEELGIEIPNPYSDGPFTSFAMEVEFSVNTSFVKVRVPSIDKKSHEYKVYLISELNEVVGMGTTNLENGNMDGVVSNYGYINFDNLVNHKIVKLILVCTEDDVKLIEFEYLFDQLIETQKVQDKIYEVREGQNVLNCGEIIGDNLN